MTRLRRQADAAAVILRWLLTDRWGFTDDEAEVWDELMAVMAAGVTAR